MRLALANSGPTYASAGGLNNHWGAPLSLARLPPEAGYGIFELGMNHPGEIASLTRLVRPHIAVITTVEPVHLGFFPSVEAIADAKAEIFLGLEPGGVAVLNRDNPHYLRLAAAAKRAGAVEILGFGAHPEAAARLSPAVQALAADVSRFLAGRAVEAHSESLLDRLARFGRRYRLPILLVLTYLVARLLLLWLVRV